MRLREANYKIKRKSARRSVAKNRAEKAFYYSVSQVLNSLKGKNLDYLVPIRKESIAKLESLVTYYRNDPRRFKYLFKSFKKNAHKNQAGVDNGLNLWRTLESCKLLWRGY